MRHTRRRGCTVRLHATIAVLLLTRLVLFAQDVTEPALKAAYVYNFVRFTEWPRELPASEPLVLCVLGSAAVSDNLERVIKGREINGRSMSISRLAMSEPMRECHVLYVSDVTTSRAAELVAGLRDAPTLTISDIPEFTRVGGMTQLFFEHGQLRFSIGLDAVTRARLKISSRVLALAKRYE